MKTIQLALRDTEYADELQNLLLKDGTHRVYLVDQPDLRLDGVIVIDGDEDRLGLLEGEAERFVVITRKGSDHLAHIWEAGARHVVFEGDAASTVHLAIIAAELRLPRTSYKGKTSSAAPIDEHRPRFRPEFPILDAPRHSAKSRFSKPPFSF